ncbi:MAG: baseplate assembly protein [Desulfobacteraceae bacterium 4572_35.1]|nr:MAG: baseplate assembly protein [Desulfobacteraceae bacterium 4572_35.1]
MTDIYGQDIKLDTAGQAMVAANGELILTEGVETGVQDIQLRLRQPLGELFYDIEFGALIYQWIKEENTSANRMGFETEVERRVQLDPRVVPGTSACKIISWNEVGITARCEWQFIDEDHPFNLVIEMDSVKQEMVIKDVNPRIG